MAALKRRHNRWEARVRVPRALEPRYEGRTHLYRTIPVSDKRAAKAEADAWEATLRAEWAEAMGHTGDSLTMIRNAYAQQRALAASGELSVHGGDEDPVEAGIFYELDKIEDAVGKGEPTPLQSARVAALQDALEERRGSRPKPRPELELTFAELAGEYVDWWQRQGGLRPSNTEQQKRATFWLFAGFWGNRPLRTVTRADAARFMDALRALNPLWGRAPAVREMSWADLQARFGGAAKGPADATLNRHAATLAALWEWGADRGHCEGRNPFTGFHRRLRPGVNVAGYRPWEAEELRRLFEPPPRRADLTEIMLVALFSGMRLDEIASLTWGLLREEEGVRYFDVQDAKTPAGNRVVPLHPALDWLWKRKGERASGRVWPKFNPEGPGKKPGADAGREFSRFKASRGFADRRKAFHSFRKNVTRQMERAGVPENEWAQVFGHEKGFTYGRYNPDGIVLKRKAEIIALIGYPELDLPQPADS